MSDDLTANEGKVMFASGQSEAELVLNVVGDDEPELNEKFIIQLLTPDKVRKNLGRKLKTLVTESRLDKVRQHFRGY